MLLYFATSEIPLSKAYAAGGCRIPCRRLDCGCGEVRNRIEERIPIVMDVASFCLLCLSCLLLLLVPIIVVSMDLALLSSMSLLVVERFVLFSDTIVRCLGIFEEVSKDCETEKDRA